MNETAILTAILGGVGFMLLAGHSDSSSGDTPNCKQPPAPSPQIGQMAAAIAQAEGSNPAWNNPGSLTASFGYATTGVGNSAGVLIFATCTDGWNALYAQLSAIVSGNSRYGLDTTLASFGMSYSGGDPNWAKNVASLLGVSTNTTLGSVLT